MPCRCDPGRWNGRTCGVGLLKRAVLSFFGTRYCDPWQGGAAVSLGTKVRESSIGLG